VPDSQSTLSSPAATTPTPFPSQASNCSEQTTSRRPPLRPPYDLKLVTCAQGTCFGAEYPFLCLNVGLRPSVTPVSIPQIHTSFNARETFLLPSSSSFYSLPSTPHPSFPRPTTDVSVRNCHISITNRIYNRQRNSRGFHRDIDHTVGIALLQAIVRHPSPFSFSARRRRQRLGHATVRIQLTNWHDACIASTDRSSIRDIFPRAHEPKYPLPMTTRSNRGNGSSSSPRTERL